MNIEYNIIIDDLPCWDLLAEGDIPNLNEIKEMLSKHLSLIGEWNSFAGLISRNDLENALAVHVLDSLSLVPIIRARCSGGGVLLDVGSGGGFPAVPIKVAAPSLRVTLVERSERKVAFLRKVVSTLGLQDVTIIQGEFPSHGPTDIPNVITARAVEKGGGLRRGLKEKVLSGAEFLCQSEDLLEDFSEMFHVEQVEDSWSTKGYRRGHLYIISRKPKSGE